MQNIIFIDIETVPVCPTYDELDTNLRALWDVKAGYLARNGETPEELYPRAGIYAEFGKVICISSGLISDEGVRIKSFFGHKEIDVLKEFTRMLNHSSSHDKLLCAHNGKEFDFPYLARRMLIQAVQLPWQLDISGRKPWEIPHIDTMEMWKFGDYKHFTSLVLLSAVFGIPTPKDDISGKDVFDVYYKENNLERIKDYCQKDVLALIKVYARLKGIQGVEDMPVKMLT